MSNTSDAIRDREEAKRPKPEPEVRKRGRKAVERYPEGWTPEPEQAEADTKEVSVDQVSASAMPIGVLEAEDGDESAQGS